MRSGTSGRGGRRGGGAVGGGGGTVEGGIKGGGGGSAALVNIGKGVDCSRFGAALIQNSPLSQKAS